MLGRNVEQSYYPKRNKTDDYNLKCYDAFCSGLIIIIKSFSFKIYCKESMYIMFEYKLQNCSPNQINKYLCSGKGEIEVNINNSSEEV
jgi:hypothetical protein